MIGLDRLDPCQAPSLALQIWRLLVDAGPLVASAVALGVPFIVIRNERKERRRVEEEQRRALLEVLHRELQEVRHEARTVFYNLTHLQTSYNHIYPWMASTLRISTPSVIQSPNLWAKLIQPDLAGKLSQLNMVLHYLHEGVESYPGDATRSLATEDWAALLSRAADVRRASHDAARTVWSRLKYERMSQRASPRRNRMHNP